MSEKIRATPPASMSTKEVLKFFESLPIVNAMCRKTANRLFVVMCANSVDGGTVHAQLLQKGFSIHESRGTRFVRWLLDQPI